MDIWLTEVAAELVERPVMQGLFTFVAATFMEKPALVACGFLIAEGNLTLLAALLGISFGILMGDVVLYGMGRFAAGFVVRWQLVHPAMVARASTWYARNLLIAIMLARGIPGLRVPVFVAAGILHMPFWRLVLTDLISAALWTLAILSVIAALGERFLPVFGEYKWYAAAAFLAVIVLVNTGIARHARKTAADDAASLAIAEETEPAPVEPTG